CLTIAHAISVSAAADTINFAIGLYPEHDLILSSNITLKGSAAEPTIIDAGAVSRALTVNAGVIATISGLTIQNGNTPGSGGGINNLGTLTLTGCIVKNNIAQSSGGIFNDGTLTVQQTTIANNQASPADLGGGIGNNGQLTITDSFFIANS